MNRQEIRAKIRKKLGETTAAFWGDAELTTWIDDACDDIAMRTLCLRGTTTLTTTVNTAEYVLKTMISDVLAIVDSQYYMNAATWYPLKATSQEELNATLPGWRSAEASTPIKYYWDLEANLLGLYPKPNTLNAGLYWLIRYAKRHTDISSETSEIDIPLELHKAIIEHVVATGLESRASRESAAYHWTMYEKYITNYHAHSDKNAHLDDDLIMVPGR